MTEGHGDDAYRYGVIESNFSSNIYSKVNHKPLMEYLSGFADELARYPEPEPFSLQERLCGDLGLKRGSVMVTNGVTEALYVIAQMGAGGCSSIIVPTFREYQDACSIHNHKISFIESLRESAPQSDMVWICNPNNPTGGVVPKWDLLSFIREKRERIIILDQAYSDYTAQPVLSPTEVAAEPNLIMLESLTKRFAVPGLRIGYAVAAPDLIERLRRFRMPWSVNALAIRAAEYLLDHKPDYLIDSALLHSEILRISAALGAFGIEASSTDTNFALFRLPDGRSAAQLKEHLAVNCGLLIRDASNFEGLDGSWFRIAAQLPQENDKLIRCIGEWIG